MTTPAFSTYAYELLWKTDVEKGVYPLRSLHEGEEIVCIPTSSRSSLFRSSLPPPLRISLVVVISPSSQSLSSCKEQKDIRSITIICTETHTNIVRSVAASDRVARREGRSKIGAKRSSCL